MYLRVTFSPIDDSIQSAFRQVVDLEAVGLLQPRERLRGPREVLQGWVLNIAVVVQYRYVLDICCEQEIVIVNHL